MLIRQRKGLKKVYKQLAVVLGCLHLSLPLKELLKTVKYVYCGNRFPMKTLEEMLCSTITCDTICNVKK